MTGKDSNIRVVVVDDSPTASGMLVAILEGAEGIEVVGIGKNGEEGVRLVKRLKPDVVTMDIVMPVMDGLEATKHIMNDQPTPIVIISSSVSRAELHSTFDAIATGALTMVRKPGLNDPKAVEEVIKTVRLMATVPTVRRRDADMPRPRPPAFDVKSDKIDPKYEKDKAYTLLKDKRAKNIKIIGIVASTGGPSALSNILKPLPADFKIPIVIIQHVANGFSMGLSDWLDGETELIVRLAGHGELLEKGKVLVGQENYHLQVSKIGFVELFKGKPDRGFMPSGNHLLHSLSLSYGRRTLGIILTGMGRDGAKGMGELHKMGGITVAQDERSCVVFGMPQVAIEQKSVDYIMNPSQIGQTLAALYSK